MMGWDDGKWGGIGPKKKNTCLADQEALYNGEGAHNSTDDEAKVVPRWSVLDTHSPKLKAKFQV